MLIYTFYTLAISGGLFLIGAILFLLPSQTLTRLSEFANRILLATDQAIVPFRKGIGFLFLAVSAWICYRLFEFVQRHPGLFQ
ncbi:MAG: hypothetical protein HYS56_05645 [Candidatus Omnitrophica bacterium]|nr:hypothetical protein [Candidatus Omnitrophota bacterium]